MSEPSIAHTVPEKYITMAIVAFPFNKPLVGNRSILVALKRKATWPRRPALTRNQMNVVASNRHERQ